MSTSTAPKYPCPSWCAGCEKYSEDGWSDYTDHAFRPHSTVVIGERDELLAAGEELMHTHVKVDIGAMERAVMLSGGRRGPSVIEQPQVGLYAAKLDDPTGGNGELSLDMSAEQARELAGWLLAAADRLDGIIL